MKALPAAVGCLLIGLAGWAVAQSTAPKLPEPIFTRDKAFTIPIKLRPSETPSQAPVEFQLHLSSDRGRTWRLADRIPPEQSSFSFQAEDDGEYWFFMRTRDVEGQLRPLAAARPEIRAVIDSVPPSIELSLSSSPSIAGQCVLTYAIDEPNLIRESLRVESRADQGQPWEPVAIDPIAPDASGIRYSGQVELQADRQSRLEVRVEATDAAGNTTSRQAVCDESQLDDPRADSESILPGRPSAGSPRDELTLPPAMAERFPDWSNGTPDSSPNVDGQTAPNDADQTGPEWPSESTNDSTPLSTVSHSRPGEAELPPHSNVPTVETLPEPSAARQSPWGPLPAGAAPRMVAARGFELDYQIDTSGRFGVERVELWGTRDFGRTWKSYGVDSDRFSPVVAMVEGEGLYGFRIEIQNIGQTQAPIPRPNTEPELWVAVDLTKPDARIKSLMPGAAGDGRDLAIEWDAVDTLLAGRPIALEYGPTSGGPWDPIASDLENTGRYEWRIGDGVPDRFFVRLTVRDEAGNVRTVESKVAVQVEPGKAKGRLKDVRPLGSRSANGPMRVENKY